MSDKSNPVMFSRQAAKFDFALERHGCPPAFVEWLSTGNNLAPIREVWRGNAEIKMREFWRVCENFGIQIPALERQTLNELLRKGGGWIEGLERDTSPTEALALRIGTILLPDENSIGGDAYEQRVSLRKEWLGYQQAAWLDDHQEEFPEFMAVENMQIDFPGTIVTGGSGIRCFPYLSKSARTRHWYLGWISIDHRLHRNNGRLASK